MARADPVPQMIPRRGNPSRQRPAERAKPSLTREAIVDAALAIVDSEGVDAVTMRRVGEALGTGAASLYAHVSDKDELLELVFDRAFVGVPLEIKPDARRWQAQLKGFIRNWHDALLTHRDLAKVVMGRVPVGPNALVGFESLAAVMRAGKLDDQTVAYATDLVAAYVVSSAYESHLFTIRAVDAAEGQFEDDLASFFESLPADRFPTIVSLARVLVGSPNDGSDRFEFGLDVIVRGLAARGGARGRIHT